MAGMSEVRSTCPSHLSGFFERSCGSATSWGMSFKFGQASASVALLESPVIGAKMEPTSASSATGNSLAVVQHSLLAAEVSAEPTRASAAPSADLVGPSLNG
mgnify:FL=1|jgi:hypothetical protein